MATTTKTLAPTNQTITIPDMTERPNASVLTDAISKEADAINNLQSNKASKAEAIRIYSSTVGFADAIGIASTADMAGVLDAKIRDKISDYTDYTTVPFNITNGGAYFFGILGKLNNNYYSGLVWSYHASSQATTWQFTNFNGTYYLRPLAERMSWPT